MQSELGEEALLSGLRAGKRSAKAALFDAHGRHVQRVLVRVLGRDPDLADLIQEVFARALEGVSRYRGDGGGVRPWLTKIAVYTARESIRRRQRRVRVVGEADVEGAEHPGASADVTLALRRAYAVLEQMDVDLRIPFALRFIDGMELTEVAAACDVSLATIKRRLVRARTRFESVARRDTVLVGWMEGDA